MNLELLSRIINTLSNSVADLHITANYVDDQHGKTIEALAYEIGEVIDDLLYLEDSELEARLLEPCDDEYLEGLDREDIEAMAFDENDCPF